jgi:ABC-type transport system substrate-binding protein
MTKLRFVLILLLVTVFGSVAFAQDAPSVTIAFAESQPNTLDPAAATSADSFLVLRNVAEGLVSYDPQTLEPIPALAESWDLSDDGTVYTFHLREGVTFSDGSTFDANDVKYSFDRLANAETGTSYTAGLVLGAVAGWSEVRPPAPPAAGDGTPTPEPVTPATSISGVEVIDPQTVQITLTAPRPSFLESLTLPGGFIVAEGQTDFTNGPIATGPYSVTEFTPDQQVVLTANDSYWGGAPAVKTATIRVIPEQSEQVLEFEAGTLDIVNVPPSDVARLTDDATFSSQLHQIPSLSTYFFRINLADAPLNDPAVRKALADAIDRETIVDTVLQGRGVPAYGLFPPGLGAYSADFKPFTYNPEQIKADLAAAGYPDGVTITLRTDQVETNVAVLNAIQQTAAPAGITINVNSTEASVYTQDRNDCNMDAGLIAWGFDYPDPENIATQAIAGSSVSRINCGYKEYGNAAAVEALNAEAAAAPLGADRDALWAQFNDLAVAQDLLTIPVYHGASTYGINPRLGGTPVDNQGAIQLDLITVS